MAKRTKRDLFAQTKAQLEAQKAQFEQELATTNEEIVALVAERNALLMDLEPTIDVEIRIREKEAIAADITKRLTVVDEVHRQKLAAIHSEAYAEYQQEHSELDAAFTAKREEVEQKRAELLNAYLDLHAIEAKAKSITSDIRDADDAAGLSRYFTSGSLIEKNRITTNDAFTTADEFVSAEPLLSVPGWLMKSVLNRGRIPEWAERRLK